jgi:glycosyltransferase involved in cell wall biosynthesis
MRPEATLVICTRNRRHSLEACLKAILAMEGIEECQVVVVDNGSTDGTREVVRAAMSRARPGQIEYVEEPHQGLSRARNRGIAQARAGILLFTDDDCYPHRDYLREARRVFADPATDYFGGRVMLHDPQDDPITTKESMLAHRLEPWAEIVPGMIHGANMGFRRNLFEKLGGFNVLLGAGTALGCAEDTEFVARAAAAGFAGGYRPEPAVNHHHRRRREEAVALMRSYDIGRGAFFVSMLGQSRVRWMYLRRWWYSFAWNRRWTALRELRGAARYLLAALLAMLARRERIPRVPLRVL